MTGINFSMKEQKIVESIWEDNGWCRLFLSLQPAIIKRSLNKQMFIRIMVVLHARSIAFSEHETLSYALPLHSYNEESHRWHNVSVPRFSPRVQLDRGLEPRSSQTNDYEIGIAAATLSMRHLGVRAKTDCLEIGMMCTAWATYLPADCSFSELYKSN